MKYPATCPPLRKLDDIGDLIPMADWLENVRDGLFIDYDGHGELATATGVSHWTISPSDVAPDFAAPAWATHVNWYNR